MKAGFSAHFPEPDFELAERFRDAMSLLAGAVAVISAGREGSRRGLTATAVCSVSVQPPTMLVCVNRFGDAHRAIAEAGSFCVNLLSHANQGVADTFAGRSGKQGSEKFDAAGWTSMRSGSPALDTAMASVDCEVVEAVEAHTHTVFFGAVREVMRGTGTGPLLHFERNYWNLS